MYTFYIDLHYGGVLKTENGKHSYIGGEVRSCQDIDPDLFSYWHLKKEIEKTLSYSGVKCLYYCIPGIDVGLNRVFVDSEVNEMCARLSAGNHPLVNIYVEHAIDNPTIVPVISKPHVNISVSSVDVNSNDDLVVNPFDESGDGRQVDGEEDGTDSEEGEDNEDDGTDSEEEEDNEEELEGNEEGQGNENGGNTDLEIDMDEIVNEKDDELAAARRESLAERGQKVQRSQYASKHHISSQHISNEDPTPTYKAANDGSADSRHASNAKAFENAQKTATPNDLNEQLDKEMHLHDSDSAPDALDSEDEDSDVEIMKIRKKIAETKYRFFNEKTDMKNVQFELGLQFRSVKVFREAVRNHAIQNRLDLESVKNNGQAVTVVCDNSENCPWRIYCSKMANEETWQIKTFTNVHRCASKHHTRQLSTKWIAHTYFDRLRNSTHMKLTTLQEELSKELELNISVTKIMKARQLVLNEATGNIIEHYAKLWEYREELRKTNPGSTIDIKYLRHSLLEPPIFDKMYVCFHALKKGFLEGCRPHIGLDGCFLKGYVKGQLLVAVGRDANNQMFPIAWGVVNVESYDNWHWFISHLIQDLDMGDGMGWTVVSDGHKGLIQSVDDLLPYAEYRSCARHVYSNWHKKWRGLAYRYAFWKIANSTCLSEYNKASQELKELDAAAHDNLKARNPEKWCKLWFNGNSKVDAVENNMTEAFNGTLVKCRGYAIIYMLEHIRVTMMERLYNRRRWMENQWDELCPRIRDDLDDTIKAAFQWDMKFNGVDKFQVEKGKQGFIVDMTSKSCTCRAWELSGIPCIHACRVLINVGKKPEDYVAHWYKKDMFLKAYKYSLQPISGEEQWEAVGREKLMPPVQKVKPGKRRLNRIKSRDEPTKRSKEKLSRAGRVMTCSNCRQKGHNIAGCKEDRRDGAGPIKKKRRTATEGEGLQEPNKENERVYKKTKNHGKKYKERVATVVVDDPAAEKRKRGRPRKFFNGGYMKTVGVTMTNTGDTLVKLPGQSAPVSVNKFADFIARREAKNAQVQSTTAGTTKENMVPTQTTSQVSQSYVSQGIMLKGGKPCYQVSPRKSTQTGTQGSQT